MVHPLVAPPPYQTAIWNELCTDGASSTCSPNFPPPEEVKPAMMYDPVDGYAVEYGGMITTALATNQTWIWNGTWTQFFPTTVPVARANDTLAWDTVDGYGILFGGWKATGMAFLNDTYKFLNGTWTKLTTPVAPSVRAGYAMVNIPLVSGKGGFVLLFGGNDGGTRFYSDTWKFSGGTWTNISAVVAGPPAGRSEAGIAYDSVDNYAVMFGGLTKTGVVNDTWAFIPSHAGGNWTQVYTNASTNQYAGPKAVLSPEMSWDTRDGAVFVNSGATGNYASPTAEVVIPYRSTWYWIGGKWTNDSANILANDQNAHTVTPNQVFGGGFADLSGYGYVLEQGGKTTAGLANWTFQLGTLISATVAVNLGEVVMGQSITVWGNASKGSPPYTYVWSTPAGCTAGNVSTFSCVISATGYQSFSLTVNDVIDSVTTAGPLKVWVDSVSFAPVTLTTSSAAPVSVPGTFWAFDYRCPPENNPACVSFVQHTPVHWFRVAGAMEGYNSTSGIDYSRFGGTMAVNWNWTDIKSFCAQIQPCYTFSAVPTQNNDTGLAVADARYVLRNYSYQPNLWSLGNEPQGWVHFNQPFSATPYPQPYNRLTGANAYQVGIVENRIAQALLSFNASARIITIQSSQCGSNSFNSQTALYTWQDNHPVIACHAYPAGVGPTGGQTLAGILSPTYLTSIPGKVQSTRAADAAACPGCNLPIWVTELNLALSGGSNAAYLGGWADVAFFGSQFVQFVQSNISMMEYFDVGCGAQSGFALLTPTCGPTPASNLYTNVFDHVRIARAWNVSVTGSVGNVFALQGTDQNGSSLFIVNANTTVSAVVSSTGTFNTQGGLIGYSGSPTLGWSTTGYAANSAPNTWTVPPLGILLLNTNTNTASGGVTPPTAAAVTTCGLGCLAASFFHVQQPAPNLLLGLILVVVGGMAILARFWDRRWIGGAIFALGLVVIFV